MHCLSLTQVLPAPRAERNRKFPKVRLQCDHTLGNDHAASLLIISHQESKQLSKAAHGTGSSRHKHLPRTVVHVCTHTFIHAHTHRPAIPNLSGTRDCYGFFFKVLFIYRQRGREGERGEKHQCVVASRIPLRGPGCNPGVCPNWESNQ